MTIDPKLIEGAVALVTLKSELGKKLFGPLFEELGHAGGDLSGIYRFYQNRNLAKIFTKWGEARDDKQALNQGDVERVLPLLPLAANQSDDDLQSRWANLLENSVSTPDAVLPSFGQTLSQLTSEEAQFMERLFAAVSRPNGSVSKYRPGREPVGYEALIAIFDPSIETPMNPAERTLFAATMTEKHLRDDNRRAQAELVIQDLERLGIISVTQRAEPDRFVDFGSGKIPVEQSKTVLRSEYSFTQYGVSFVRAVSPAKHRNTRSY